ncbi:apoptosis-associated speck-like protein containing a CARD isoform X1 [Brachyistius frenatus]|uniref:apoptosis-associated speck-like protein containing a CARD isoform X1 n=1 Tax=Brachyistius frenatus TaxID=100188 RepID=UPI0037E70560
MAGSSIRKAVAGALEDLTEKDFQKFCFHLLDRRDEPRVKRNRVEGKDFMEITDVLVNHFTEEGAVLVTVDLLNQIGCCGVAKTLGEETAGRSSAAAEQHGKKDQHFVDKHRNELIQRVSNVGPILDELLTKVIQQERYDAIRAVKPSQEQMRDIYGVLLKAGTDAKDIFYNILQKHEKCLLQDLQK